MKHKDLELIATLMDRTNWREGSVDQRLRKVEDRARWRAKTGAYGCDVERERRIAKLAKRVREARARRRKRSIKRANRSRS